VSNSARLERCARHNRVMSQRIVAFLDVLGFKALVETVSQKELLDIYGQLQAAASIHTTRTVFPDDHRRWDSDAYYAPEEITRQRVANVVMASDSIVVYSPGDSYLDAMTVTAAVRGLIVAGFRTGVALRGALAIGELDELDIEDIAAGADNWTARFSGLIGLGLVRAYELEALSNWSGAIVHPDLIAHLDAVTVSEHEDGHFTALDQMCASLMLVETEVPMKRAELGISRTPWWAVHWPALAASVDWQVTEREVVAAFTSFGREADARAAQKRDATVAFMGRAAADATATTERRSLRWRN
jgi:hypothetical protein